MGEFDRARNPGSASLTSGPRPAAMGAQRMRGQVATLYRLTGTAQGSATMLATNAARATIYLKRALVVWGLVRTAWDILSAGHDAMTIERRMVADLAAAHAFAAWVFEHRQAATPLAMPERLRLSHEAEDAAGNANVITAEQFARTWREGALTTKASLDRALRGVNMGSLTAELTRRMGSRAQLHMMSRDERLGLMRVMMAGDFDNSPQAAARIFHLSRMDGYGATARGVAAVLMRDHPYRGAA